MAKNMPWPKLAPPPRISTKMPSTARPFEAAMVDRNSSHLGISEPAAINTTLTPVATSIERRIRSPAP